MSEGKVFFEHSNFVVDFFKNHQYGNGDRVIKEEHLESLLFIQVDLSLALVKKNKNIGNCRKHFPGIFFQIFKLLPKVPQAQYE